MSRLRIPAWAVPVTLLFLIPASADAAVRYASPTADAQAGRCEAADPCALEVAVNGAAPGDEVVVAAGTYDVSVPLVAAAEIHVRGAAGAARPRLVGSPKLGKTVLTLSGGGSVSGLRLEAAAQEGDALEIDAGLGQDLVLLSASGDGGELTASAAGTILRDSVVQTAADHDDRAAVRLKKSDDGTSVTLVNVTALAPSAIGVRCEIERGRAALVNTIVRGLSADVDADKTDGRCTAANSSLRPDVSPGLAAAGPIQTAEPRFVDAAGGDYRPALGSPTIDAGAAHPLLGSTDPAGCPRSLGAAPDIGAFEYAGPFAACAGGEGAPADVPDGDAPHPPADRTPPEKIDAIIRGVPAPVEGRTVVVAPGRGKVRVRRPGSRRFRRLEASDDVPVGSVLDARKGRVKLVSAVDADGRLQLGTFWGAKFQVRQRRRGRGMTVLKLRGGNFDACRAGTRAVAAKRRKRKRVRRLWGRDRGGRYRTHGQHSAATTRGTRWLTVDRCDGTVTRVTHGAVVVRDRVRHRKVIVRAGERYLAAADGRRSAAGDRTRTG